MAGVTYEESQASLREHLAWWGLRHVESDEAYFAWQRQVFTPQELSSFHQHIDVKRRHSGDPAAEIAFYDLTAQPRSVPVLYSQRYEYYLQVGARIARHLRSATTLLDVGCGIGILTTFYAKQYPDCSVLGIDRSPASITLAQQRAEELGLTNVRFECVDLDRQDLEGRFDCLVATHVLLQAEQERGLSSRDWRTFERTIDPAVQQAFEVRTGLGVKLDRLRAACSLQGRVVLFEKARQLARRVPLQRALATHGWHLLALTESVRYRLIEEVTDDGPLYVLGPAALGSGLPWDESPEPDGAVPLDFATVQRVGRKKGEPLYENHTASAQAAWQSLPNKGVIQEATGSGANGWSLHVEWGRADRIPYLYCADTFDRRQLVVVDEGQAAELEVYYREIAGSLRGEAGG